MLYLPDSLYSYGGAGQKSGVDEIFFCFFLKIFFCDNFLLKMPHLGVFMDAVNILFSWGGGEGSFFSFLS